MAYKGVAALIGVATVAGLAGLFAFDEFTGKPYEKKKTMRRVHLPQTNVHNDDTTQLTMQPVEETEGDGNSSVEKNVDKKESLDKKQNDIKPYVLSEENVKGEDNDANTIDSKTDKDRSSNVMFEFANSDTDSN